MVRAIRGVAITPTPVPKPAFEIPMSVTEQIAEIQKSKEWSGRMPVKVRGSAIFSSFFPVSPMLFL